MKKLILLILLITSTCLQAGNPYRTRIFAPNIKTLQAEVMDERFSLPVIELQGTQKVHLRFDEMSHVLRTYTYKVIHCNADWSPSDISTSEYLTGYTNAYIQQAEQSINTHYLYTHYQFSLPNDEIAFKISGNYLVIIYEENEPDKPVAQACFSVVDPKVSIDGKIRANTDTELSGRMQQIDFEVMLNGFTVRDPMTEIKTFIRQNNRTDNEVSQLIPSFLGGNKLSYINNQSLIFEGGNEYHNFDISSVYAAGRGVERIRFEKDHYEATLNPDKVQKRIYEDNEDVNGRFLINEQDAITDVHTEADYMLVHFTLPTKQPWFDGQLYLGGEFNYNQMNETSRMKYDNIREAYTQTILLKQGGYNYQYWFLPKGAAKASAERVEGSHWQTRNEYTIYIYHRGWGERYDKLVGMKTIQ